MATSPPPMGTSAPQMGTLSPRMGTWGPQMGTTPRLALLPPSLPPPLTAQCLPPDLEGEIIPPLPSKHHDNFPHNSVVDQLICILYLYL